MNGHPFHLKAIFGTQTSVKELGAELKKTMSTEIIRARMDE
jgi:hypothetical protein